MSNIIPIPYTESCPNCCDGTTLEYIAKPIITKVHRRSIYNRYSYPGYYRCPVCDRIYVTVTLKRVDDLIIE